VVFRPSKVIMKFVNIHERFAKRKIVLNKSGTHRLTTSCTMRPTVHYAETWCHWCRLLATSWNDVVLRSLMTLKYLTRPRGWVSTGLTFYSTLYMSFQGRFLQARWPNQQCQSTEGSQLATEISLNPTRTTPLCYSMIRRQQPLG